MRISDWSSDVCSSDLQASAEGTLDFYGLQAQVARCMVIGGEPLVRFRLRRKTDGLTVPLQLQVLEGDYVPFDKNDYLGCGSDTDNGIKLDTSSSLVTYSSFLTQPSDQSQRVFPTVSTTTVLAYEVP